MMPSPAAAWKVPLRSAWQSMSSSMSSHVVSASHHSGSRSHHSHHSQHHAQALSTTAARASSSSSSSSAAVLITSTSASTSTAIVSHTSLHSRTPSTAVITASARLHSVAAPLAQQQQQQQQQREHADDSHSHSRTSRASRTYRGGVLAALAALSAATAMTQQQESAQAQAAPAAAPAAAPTTEPFLPTIAFQAPKPKPASAESLRPPLPNPGKFDNMHNDATNAASSQAFAGGRVQLALVPLQWFPTNTQLDRELVVVPIMQATPEGQHGMLNVRTNLGTAHHLEAMVDTNGVSVGKYRFRAGPWTIKPAFQLVPDQEQFTFEVAYKGREFFAQLMVANLAELVLSYNQSLTSKLSAGVQLHTAFPQITFLNFTGRYRFDRGDQVALSSKNGMYVASYFRPVFEKAGTPQYPAQALTMAAEWRISQKTGQSQVSVGMQHSRATFRYHASMASDWSVGMTLEQVLAMGASLSLSGEMKFDGSGESRFGIGLSHQF